MKQISVIYTLVILLGCTNQNTNKESKKSEEPQATEQHTFPSEFLGCYISSDYLDELEKHGSTKNAQEKAILSTAHLYKKNEDIIFSNTWNFHEGGGSDFVKMISSTKAIIIEEISKDTIYEIDFSKDGEIIVKEDKNSFRLTQFSKDYKNKNYSKLINSKILSGQLSIDDSVIQFKPNGDIIGLDSIIGYLFHEDYYDAGMQFDMIYLQYQDNRSEEVFGYELTDSTFHIFKLICKEKDEKYNYCLVRDRGDSYLTIKKELK